MPDSAIEPMHRSRGLQDLLLGTLPGILCAIAAAVASMYAVIPAMTHDIAAEKEARERADIDISRRVAAVELAIDSMRNGLSTVLIGMEHISGGLGTLDERQKSASELAASRFIALSQTLQSIQLQIVAGRDPNAPRFPIQVPDVSR